VNKILSSILVIGVVAALMGVGTFAYFSDIETSTGNTISTGIIDLEVDGQNPWSASFQEEIKPGRTFEKDFTLHMTEDSNPAKAWFRITDVVDSGGSCMSGYTHASSEPEYVAEGGTYTDGTPNNDNTPRDDLSNHIKVDISFDSDVSGWRMWYIDNDNDGDYEWVAISESGTPSTDKMPTLAEVNTFGWIQLTGDCELPHNLTPCTDYTFHLSFHNTLNGDNNEYQGDMTTFTIEFYATQIDGTGPT